jgi:hypothetical protein
VVSDIVSKMQQVAKQNSTTILTGIGVAGTVTTAVLSGRAGFKAAGIIQAEAIRRSVINEHEEQGDVIKDPRLTTKEKVELVWPQYIPAVGVGSLTVTSIIFANRLSLKETAAMAAAYGLSEKRFEEYRIKVSEKLGLAKETELRDKIAQERVDGNPPGDRTIIITGSGEVLCYDTLSDRYFNSTMEAIRRAENVVNGEIVTNDCSPLSRFYEEVGLKATAFSESVWWNIDNRCDVQVSTVMSPEDKPCLSIDFAIWPKPDHEKVWGT